MQNKRGQGMSTNAIILIILGIVVLVVLILGFTLGWNKVAPWISSSNVDTIVASCEAACSTNGVYDYCVAGRDLKSSEGKLKDVTCNYLAEQQPVYGVDKCASIKCENVFIVQASDEDSLPNYCTESGQVIQALIEDTLYSYTCS